MKKMLRMVALAAVLFVAVTTVAKAQGGGGRGRGPDVLAILKDSLKVSDDVATKAEAIIKAAQTESQSLMEAARGGDADARTKMMAVRTKQNADIKALLTDEQKAQFDKLVPAGGGRRGGGL